MGSVLNHRQTMKIENQRRILRLIHKNPVSRIAIAGETGLTQASVSMIVDELIQNGIIIETDIERDEAALGRKPTLLDINGGWGCAVGVSIDRDGCDVGIVDLKGRLIEQCERFPCAPDYGATLDEIRNRVGLLISRRPEIKERVLSAGAAVPGPFDSASGKMLNPPGFFEEWFHLDLRAELKKRLDIPVVIEHNSIALAKAEICFGREADYGNFILINVNAGLGAGLVLNGKVYSGKNGYGGEFGHTSIDMNGILCPCGNRGCIEQYASVSAILHNIRRFRQNINSWPALVDLAYEGDELCARFIEDEAEYLSHAIISLNNLLGLDAAVITGKIAYRPERLLESIKTRIGKHTLTKNYRPVEIRTTSLKSNPYIVSGAAIVIERIFNEKLFFHHHNSLRHPENQAVLT